MGWQQIPRQVPEKPERFFSSGVDSTSGFWPNTRKPVLLIKKEEISFLLFIKVWLAEWCKIGLENPVSDRENVQKTSIFVAPGKKGLLV
mgnify:CR=1 FL=1